MNIRRVQTHMGRAVRVKAQLRSHKKFATAFPKYSHLVDNARLYCTNAVGVPPKLIAWKDKSSNLLVDQEDIKSLTSVVNLNDEADSIFEMYKEEGEINEAGSVWNDVVLKPERSSIQLEIRTAVRKLQLSPV